jgi:hydrogenase maturation protein HypF
VWQNATLLRQTLALLEKESFVVYTHQLVPANDGGLALGQAAVAAFRLINDEGTDRQRANGPQKKHPNSPTDY